MGEALEKLASAKSIVFDQSVGFGYRGGTHDLNR